MQVPAIHLNGSSPADLMEGYQNAVFALNEAFSAVQKTAPNNRDYYVISADTGNVAFREHRERLAKIQSVIDELMASWEHVDAEAAKRRVA